MFGSKKRNARMSAAARRAHIATEGPIRAGVNISHTMTARFYDELDLAIENGDVEYAAFCQKQYHAWEVARKEWLAAWYLYIHLQNDRMDEQQGWADFEGIAEINAKIDAIKAMYAATDVKEIEVSAYGGEIQSFIGMFEPYRGLPYDLVPPPRPDIHRR